MDRTFRVLNRMIDSEFEDEGLMIEGWPVQFLPVAGDLDAEGLDQAVENEVEGVRIWVLRPEYLVTTALKVGRPKDYVRIHAFISSGELDRSALAGVLERHHLWDAWKAYCRKFDITDPTWIDLRR